MLGIIYSNITYISVDQMIKNNRMHAFLFNKRLLFCSFYIALTDNAYKHNHPPSLILQNRSKRLFFTQRLYDNNNNYYQHIMNYGCSGSCECKECEKQHSGLINNISHIWENIKSTL